MDLMELINQFASGGETFAGKLEAFNPFFEGQAIWNTYVALAIVTVTSFSLVALLPPKLPSELLSILLAFSFGIILGDVFMHGLPEIITGHSHEHAQHRHSKHHHDDHNGQLWLVVYGIVAFFALQKLIAIVTNGVAAHSHNHESHDHDQDHDHDHAKVSGAKASDSNELSTLFLSSFAHAFTDGIALASAFCSGVPSGVSTLVALLFHETPHRLGEYAILIRKQLSKIGALVFMLAAASGGLFGASVVSVVRLGPVVGFNSQNVEDFESSLKQVAVGAMLYMGLVTVLPELLTIDKAGKLQNLLILITQVAAVLYGASIMASVQHG